MKNLQHAFILGCGLALSLSSFAQYQAVVFDYQNAYFNNGQALPAEENLMISGGISKKIERVEIAIFNGKGNHKRPLYINNWKRGYGNVQENFQLPFNYKLKGDGNYDFSVEYYRMVTEEEKTELRKSLHLALGSYLGQSFEASGKKVKMLRSESTIMHDLNFIMKDAVKYYRNESEVIFTGFSDIVRRGVGNMADHKLRRGEAAKLGDVTEKNTRLEAIAKLYDQRLAELEELINNEADQITNTHLLIRADQRMISDYPTEHTKHELCINGGYGATYFNGNTKNVDYGTAPYLGLSFPLGNSALSNRFWSNSSLSVGAFVTNMKNKNGDVVSGPIFNRPYYVGYGYKVFRFVRLNAGAAFLETRTVDGKKFSVRPFLGVSAEFNLWLGLGDKRN